jgi:hypothetical protein
MHGVLVRLGPAGLAERGTPVLVADSFNRADDPATLGRCDTGQTWQPQAGTWGVLGGRAYAASGAAGDLVVLPVPLADGIVRVDLTWTAGEETLLLARYGGGCDFLQLGINASGGVALHKVVGCVFTQLGADALGATSGSTHQLALAMLGAKLRVVVDGVPRFEATAVELIANRAIGFRLGNNAPNARFDNLRFERWTG